MTVNRPFVPASSERWTDDRPTGGTKNVRGEPGVVSEALNTRQAPADERSRFSDSVMPRRSRLWPVVALVAIAALCGSLFVVAPGSIQTLGAAAELLPAVPRWAQPCLERSPVLAPQELTFCARVEGRVIAAHGGASGREVHLLVTGDFHLTLVELKPGERAPAFGSWVTAVGPLFRGDFGLRELRALSLTAA
jgi:hypothetical protein